MNMAANQGWPISPGFTLWLAELRGRAPSLLLATLIALCSGVMWMKIDVAEGLRE
jgi:ACS family glucarate transporter-like MFS transporter